MPIRVAIFEDNKLVRDSFEAILNGTDGFICTGSFSSCNSLVHDVKRSQPDVILMDIEMNGINGIEATKTIKQEFPSIKILIQTVFEDDDKVFYHPVRTTTSAGSNHTLARCLVSSRATIFGFSSKAFISLAGWPLLLMLT